MGFKRTAWKYVVAAVACSAFLFAGGSSAWAQSQTTKRVSVSFNQTPIQTALSGLFTQVGLNYSLDPGISGYVTASLRDVPFSVALNAILNANRPALAYQVHDGVYQIHSRYQTQSRAASNLTQSARPATYSKAKEAVRIPLMYASAAELMQYALGGGRVIPSTTLGRQGRTGSSGYGSRNGSQYGGGRTSGSFGGSQYGGGRAY